MLCVPHCSTQVFLFYAFLSFGNEDKLLKCVIAWKLDAGGIRYVIKMNMKDASCLKKKNGQHSELLQI